MEIGKFLKNHLFFKENIRGHLLEAIPYLAHSVLHLISIILVEPLLLCYSLDFCPQSSMC
jgi:hypothetical protein